MRDCSLTITAGDVSLTDVLNSDEPVCYALKVGGTELLVDAEDLSNLVAVIEGMNKLYEGLGKEP